MPTVLKVYTFVRTYVAPVVAAAAAAVAAAHPGYAGALLYVSTAAAWVSKDPLGLAKRLTGGK